MMSAAEVAGPKQQGKKTDRDIAYHGKQGGRVMLKERQLQVSKPRLRHRNPKPGESGEVEIPAYQVMSSDYDKTDKSTQRFFATVQNILIYAVTRKTAAELITARAKIDDPNFGLLHWKGTKVRKEDILTAKNYLTEDEIDTLNRLVVIFLETAELRAKSKQETRMAFWKENVDQIITSNG